jgi:hypothetical protein
VFTSVPPGIPASPLRTYWPPSPCACLSHARTTTRPPPHPAASSRQRTCPPPDRLPGGQGGRGWFPRSPEHRSARPALSYTPAASPRLRRRPSTRPPHRLLHTASELTASRRRSRTAPRPLSTRFEPALITRLRPLIHSRYAPDLASRTRTVWQYQHVPALSGLLPTLTGAPRIRLPPASIRPLRRPKRKGLPPLSTIRRLVAHTARKYSSRTKPDHLR